MKSLVGVPVTVQLLNGQTYEGILSTGWWDEECPPEVAAATTPGVVIRWARTGFGRPANVHVHVVAFNLVPISTQIWPARLG